MSKDRRKRIAEALALIEEARDILVEVRNEESEAYENLPEGIMYSERGEQMTSNVDEIDEYIGYIESTESLEEM